MERHKFTFADGSSTEELIDSDNETIVAATAASGGSSWGCMSSAMTTTGRCYPRNFFPVAQRLLPSKHRDTRCPKIPATSAAGSR